MWKATSPTNAVGWLKTRRIALSCSIKNIAGRFFGLVTKHACDRQTDGQTDGQNYDSEDRASIAASRGKNRSHVAFCGSMRYVPL